VAEPALHFSIPFSVLSYLRLDPAMCLIVSVAALVPDLDILFRVHRSVSHSAVLYLPVAVLGIVASVYSSCWSVLLFATWFSLTSHVLLDTVSGFSPIFWPLSKEEVCVSVALGVRVGNSVQLRPEVSIRRKPLDVRQRDSLDAVALTLEGALVSVLLLAVSVSSFMVG